MLTFMLVTKPLSDALTQLETNFGLTTSPLARTQPELVPTFRTAAVKSFKYVYELSVRFIRRALERKAVSSAEIDEMDFKTLIRTAAEKGLIDDPLPWYLFREKRNITAHTYDQTKAIDVLAVVPQVIGHVRFLLKRVRERDAS
jgi:nucleotidyltransferase substrate binding protein (TIGR01987 family)